MRVAVFGTGLMGAPMATALAKRGYEVTVISRTASKAKSLADLGIRVALQPFDALKASECAIVMLSDARAIAEVFLNAQTAVHLTGRTIIQMGTIGPTESRQLADEVTSYGDYIEAPALGSIPQVLSASLIVMVGVEYSSFERWQSLLRVFGGPRGLVSSLVSPRRRNPITTECRRSRPRS